MDAAMPQVVQWVKGSYLKGGSRALCHLYSSDVLVALSHRVFVTLAVHYSLSCGHWPLLALGR